MQLERKICTWSLIAKTSHILALRQSLLHTLMNVSLSSFVPSPYYCLCIFHSQLSTLLESCLSSIPVIVVSWVPSSILPSALIALVNRQGQSSDKTVLSISMPCQYDLTHDFVYQSCSTIQENIIFDRTNDRFSFEVLTSMGDVILAIGTWEKMCSIPSIQSSWTKKME
jgi:hypothetical protein